MHEGLAGPLDFVAKATQCDGGGGEGPDGAPYIATVSGRGCRFVVPVIVPRQADGAGPEQLPRHARRHNLPV